MSGIIVKRGDRFGRLTIVEEVHYVLPSGATPRRFLCKCDCGNLKEVFLSHLRRGNIRSCGCVAKETASNNSKKHGLFGTRIYKAWDSMKRRCYAKNASQYDHYGERGIIVCDEWKNDFMSFYQWAIANGYKDNLTLDRIDVNGNYEPQNCRWVTRKEQSNNKRNTVYLEYNGIKHSIGEWSSITGISTSTLYTRIKLGWNVKDVIEKPLIKRKIKQ